MNANQRIKALMALTLLSLASCGDSSEEGKAKDAAAESAPAQEAQPAAAPAEQPAPEQAAGGDTAASAAENAAKENAATANATGTLPPSFAQDGSLDASGSASEGVAPVISDDFLVPEADPERDLEGLGDRHDAPAMPDVPAALP